MCDPVSAAVVAGVTMVASTGASIIAQAKTAKAQTKALEEQSRATTAEIRQAASGELFDEMRASRREQARIRAAAGEAGLSLESGSIESLLFDSTQQGELQGSRMLANMESRYASNDASTKSAASKITKPTALGAGIQLASAGVSAWSGVRSAQIKVAASKRRLLQLQPTAHNQWVLPVSCVAA